ncbi:MAG: FG-GAP-like repeat-containing protein [Pyrinomonadaceae bacterium MAG19_C2-C3]|nr:FG-GAP-like repeat-containing protein [Pyrinomonadaceae bacterium MAG19_C2-C3]
MSNRSTFKLRATRVAILVAIIVITAPALLSVYAMKNEQSAAPFSFNQIVLGGTASGNLFDIFHLNQWSGIKALLGGRELQPGYSTGAAALMNFDPCTTPSFAAATNFPMGTKPRSIAVGDLNGDGKADIVTANETTSPNVAIRFGDGAGGFAAPVNVAAGSNPGAVALGDLNGDGKLDLVIANQSSNNVTVRLNNGTGGFPTGTNSPAGTKPVAVVLKDFDGDNDLDIATGNRNSANISVLLNLGAGTFGSANPYLVASGAQPISLTAGDFDGDGDQDLAVASEATTTNNVFIMTNSGTGAFTTAAPTLTAPSPRSIVAGDFDGSGRFDLAVANNGTRNVSVLLNNNAGGFNAAVNYSVGPSAPPTNPLPTSVATSDLNGDGHLDLVVSSHAMNYVSILLGNGAGGFGTATTFSLGTVGDLTVQPFSVAVGDFNGDTRPDIVVANITRGDASILINTCGATDLKITKLVVGALTTGSDGNYTLRVENVSANDSSGAITVTDTLPAGLNYVSAIGENWNCSAINQEVTCASVDGFSLVAGASASITLTVGVDSAAFPSVTNTASVANAGDVNAANNSATVTTAINRPPTADAQSVNVNEDASANVTLTGADPDGDTLTFIVVAQPANGTLTGTGANLTYTPAANFNGTDTFTFKTNDGKADSGTATVSITVNPLSDAPTATGQSLSTNEDTPLAITLTGADVDGEPLAFSIMNAPANGTLGALGAPSCTTTNGVSNCAANVTYTPAANFNGTDSFIFRVDDGTGQFQTATVSISVNSTDNPPVATNDEYSVVEDNLLSVSAPGVLTNDTDIDSSTLTAALVSNVSNGTLVLSGNGSFTYTPNLNFSGTDTFTYRANDGTSNSNTATVTITVTPVNDAPVANNQSVTPDEDTTTNITLTGTDPDGDTLTYTVVTQPANGTLTGAGANLAYAPAANFNGSDSFTFQTNDGQGDSDIATVSITVNAVNDPPVASDQSLATDEDTPLAVTLAATDVETGAFTFAVVNQPAHGQLTGTGANLTYTPNTNFNGADSFTFKANDGQSDSEIATVSITVNAVNDAPVAVGDAYSVNVNNTLTVAAPGVIANDPDAELNPLSVGIVATTTNGTLTLDANGSFTYQPNENFSGSDSFTYMATDGQSFSNTATVSITVNPVADLSLVKADSADPVPSGSSLTYTITVANAGPSTATNVVVTDALPTGDTFDSVTPSQGSCSGTSTITCNLGALAANSTATVTINIFTPTAPGVISNTASVTANEIDNNTANNSDTETTASFFDSCATPNFTGAINYATTSRPESVAISDFNGDGKADLAVVNRNSSPGKVSIFLNTGAGNFGTKIDYNVGATPRFVAVGDFNGDNKPDLAVANRNDNNVSILLGNGTGGFTATAPVVAGTNPFGIGVSDFDGDGKADLAVTNENSSNVSILFGDGAGGFVAQPTVTVGSSPRSVAVGDFNGDNKPDLAVANFSTKNVSILLNNGTGGFGSVTNISTGTGLGPTSITTGEFNGDGKLDLAVVIESTNNIAVLLGNGTGGFNAATFFPSGGTTLNGTPKSIAVGDFNTNGKVDLVVANGTNASVLEGDGAGGFAAPTTFATGNGAWSVAVGDLSGDGRLDIAVANAGANNVSVLFNSCGAADLVMTKSHQGNFTVGTDGVYDLTVTNVGSNPTFGTITVTDTLPNGLSYVSAAGAGWNCSANGQTVTCTHSDPIASGTNSSIALTVGVGAAAAPSVTNTASVSNASDINTANNSSSNPTIVTPAANLALTMIDSPDPVAVDNNLTYTISVVNNGLSTANSVVVTDTLPSGATFVSASASRGTGCTPGTGIVSCNLGSLILNASATVTVVVRPTATGPVTNSATVTANELDSDTANNTAAQETSVILGGDISIVKTASPNPVNAGSNVSYAIRVTATGQASSNVRVTDNLPSNMTFFSCSATGGGVCGGTGNNRTVTWSTLPDGATYTATIIATITSNVQNGTVINNTATVSSTTPDPNATNNSATTPVTVGAPIVQTNPTGLNFGNQPATLTSAPQIVTVMNTGGAPLTFTSITITGTIASSSAPNDFKISSNTCTGASVAPGASCAIGIQFTPSATSGRSAILRLEDNAFNTPQLVALDGRGVSQTAAAWGTNSNGQLGDNTTTLRRTPVQVIGFGAGARFAAGADHSLGLKPDGTVWAWGVNTNGQLGINTTTLSRSLQPVQVKGLGGTGFLSGVTAIKTGDKHSLALKDGRVYAWGFNSNGQLGDGTTTQRLAPIEVVGLTNVIAIGGGASHSVALRGDGTVWVWGTNAAGQVGDNTTTRRLTPVQVKGLGGVGFLEGISAIAADGNHNLAIRQADGAVIAWGLNTSGQLGNNSSSRTLVPVQVLNLTGVSHVAAGANHSLALRSSDSAIFAWGSNNNGQLGDGSTVTVRVPVRTAVGVIGAGVGGISAGANHSIVFRNSDGRVFGWGSNSAGQLGNGSTATRFTTPVEVMFLSGMRHVAAGGNHSLAAAGAP